MALKTDELVRELSEALAVYHGKGPQYWREHTEKACEYIIALDVIFAAAKKDAQRVSEPIFRSIIPTFGRASG